MRRSLTRRGLLERGALAAVGLLGLEVRPAAAAGRFPGADAYGAEVPAGWFDLARDLVRTTPGFSPPVASRAFGYVGVALHEAVLPARSFAGRVNGLTPPAVSPDDAYHWPSVANAALAEILRLLFPTAPNAGAIGVLEQGFAEQAQAALPPGIYKRSVARGAEVARHVFDWSKSDGGHEGFRTNFPPYTPPAGPGLWLPTPPDFSSALQPSWGSNRPFALPNGDFGDPGPPPAYSEAPGSAFHTEAKECYEVVTALTAEQTAIARFWSDDPGQTATPPGHSISILTQIVRLQRPSLALAAEAYAKAGMAVADAFISCWRTKYRYNLLRPVTYVQRVIDPTWTPLLVTPPFPEYTSGHSVQSGAAAAVMTALFGRVAFTDHTHDARGLPARSFNSFAEAAEEAAVSRLYGGIHFRSAIERGLEQGRAVAARANAL